MKHFFEILVLALIVAALSCASDHREEPGGYVIPEFYHSPEEINIFLEDIHKKYKDITRVITIGNSVSGRDIKAIIISGNPYAPESKPRIRLTGGIHGSEIISSEIMIYFIRYLVENYNVKDTDNEITKLIDSRYIAIIPVLNPDGLAVAGRRNDNGVDLNRNFDANWASGSGHGTEAFSEPESQALRKFSLEQNFHLSVTFHSGAVLVNIPFDYRKDVPLENDLVREFAFAYSRAGVEPNRFMDNPDIYKSQDMEDGIINGGDWYVITGSLQDWSYLKTGCLDLTVEVAKRTPKTEEEAMRVFDYNRDSIVAYIQKGGQGVYGRVTDGNGAGVREVEIKTVYNNGEAFTGDIVIKTDEDGYYHRILLPGDYRLSFQKTGYETSSIDVTVPDSDSGILENITLTP